MKFSQRIIKDALLQENYVIPQEKVLDFLYGNEDLLEGWPEDIVDHIIHTVAKVAALTKVYLESTSRGEVAFNFDACAKFLKNYHGEDPSLSIKAQSAMITHAVMELFSADTLTGYVRGLRSKVIRDIVNNVYQQVKTLVSLDYVTALGYQISATNANKYITAIAAQWKKLQENPKLAALISHDKAATEETDPAVLAKIRAKRQNVMRAYRDIESRAAQLIKELDTVVELIQDLDVEIPATEVKDEKKTAQDSAMEDEEMQTPISSDPSTASSPVEAKSDMVDDESDSSDSDGTDSEVADNESEMEASTSEVDSAPEEAPDAPEVVAKIDSVEVEINDGAAKIDASIAALTSLQAAYEALKPEVEKAVVESYDKLFALSADLERAHRDLHLAGEAFMKKLFALDSLTVSNRLRPRRKALIAKIFSFTDKIDATKPRFVAVRKEVDDKVKEVRAAIAKKEQEDAQKAEEERKKREAEAKAAREEAERKAKEEAEKALEARRAQALKLREERIKAEEARKAQEQALRDAMLAERKAKEEEYKAALASQLLPFGAVAADKPKKVQKEQPSAEDIERQRLLQALQRQGLARGLNLDELRKLGVGSGSPMTPIPLQARSSSINADEDEDEEESPSLPIPTPVRMRSDANTINITPEFWERLSLNPRIESDNNTRDYTISAHLPHLKQDSVEMAADGDTLSLAGICAPTAQEQALLITRLRQEAPRAPKSALINALAKIGRGRFGKFERHLQFPEDADLSSAKASYRDDILHITVPRKRRQPAYGFGDYAPYSSMRNPFGRGFGGNGFFF